MEVSWFAQCTKFEYTAVPVAPKLMWRQRLSLLLAMMRGNASAGDLE